MRIPFDIECYPNYFLIGFKNGRRYKQFEIRGEHATFSAEDIAHISQIIAIPLWSFNGNNYDVPMLGGALSGLSCEMLHAVSEKLIVHDIKPWHIEELPKRFALDDHIDIIEVLPGQHGQKYYAGMAHFKTMRDLPIAPGTILTEQQMDEVADYNRNDLGQLEALATLPDVQEAIELREFLSAKYGLDVRSKSDAQVAEAILVKQCGNPPKVDPPIHQAFKFDAPAYLSFQTPQLQEVLTAATSAEYMCTEKGLKLPPELEGRTVTIDGQVYRMGIGGLHSSEDKVAHICADGELLVDIDVDSYYPSMMMNAGAYPATLGENFLVEFGKIREQRLAAKKAEKVAYAAGDMAEYHHQHAINIGMKIMINGTFGKTGSLYSKMFAPKMTVQTTVLGQLLLLLLIERGSACGLQAVSANTDGVVFKIKHSQWPMLDRVVKSWERTTGMTMERNAYDRLLSHSVNDYVARYAMARPSDLAYFTGDRAAHLGMFVKSPKMKRKGEFAPTSLWMKKVPDMEIVGDAVAQWVLDGTPLRQTIEACADVRKFATIRNVKGGAYHCDGEVPEKNIRVADMTPRLEQFGWSLVPGKKTQWQHPQHEGFKSAKAAYLATFPEAVSKHYLGKAVRWYHSNECLGIIVNSSGGTVSDSRNVRPMMVLPDALPADIDFDYYVNVAEKALINIGVNDYGKA